ncbi:MAG: cupin domain-containing protein [Deltaproteobacteria bacterium]|nr:cupin domain-containing protein [Deltaproteobacteria bacterium]
MDNLLLFPESLRPDGPEFSETVCAASGAVRVERILSLGHVTPEGVWYDQAEDEWVAVLEGTARIAYPDGSEVSLARGDHLFLPRHVRHRVAYTSSPCVWLAVFGQVRPGEPGA